VLTAERVEITTGPGCEPRIGRGLREKGEKHDAMDKPAVSAAASDSDGKK
jgi:pilus assembly protein HofP